MTDSSQELDAIIANFLQAFEANRDSVSREELIAKNPKFADALRAFFANLDDLQPVTVQYAKTANLESITFQEEAQGSILGGRYKLIECIGEGGMGTVWLAEQTQPIRRKVAIKLIKAGMDTKHVLSRFEAERQALAVMDHPNIAKVFDGGSTDSGRPYFVMEYVKGIPFTEYCDKAKLSLKDRLLLFIPVCHAVQHAHHKGIVHRDLKPSNLLICLYDGKPVPKVIDFGLAKAMHQPLTDKSIFTSHGMMVGTPLYMSPEQAELNNLDVDTRSDVYSLGVVLYELLTGTTPLERQRLRAAAYNEILRLIKEVEPLRPSIKLSGSDSLPSVAAQRSIDPRELRRTLAGDLDWIVMKALEKERSRRYETANGLARDIERFLNEEAVEACPPSSTYRLKKILKKHRGKVIAAGLLATTLLLGIVGTTLGFIASSRSAKKLKESNAALTDFSNGLLAILEHGYAEMQDTGVSNSRYKAPDFELYAEFKNGKVTSTNSAITQSLESKSARERVLSELDMWLTTSIRGEKEAIQLLEQKNYRVGLQAAYTAIKNGELTSAKSLLNDLPEALRGWEWSWLMAETDKSLLQTSIPDGRSVVAVTRNGLYCVLKEQSESATELQVMDSTTGKLAPKIYLPEAKRILGVALSKDASLCIICAALELDSTKGLRSSLFVWDTQSEKVIRRYDSGFDLNNFLFTVGILDCSDSGRQISVSCYGQFERMLNAVGASLVIRDFNVMTEYAVFDLDEEDTTPAFYGEVTVAPDGRLFSIPKLPPASTAMIVEHSEKRDDEAWDDLKFSPDGTMLYRCINQVWEEVRQDESHSTIGEIQDFEEFEFYDHGGAFVGIREGFLRYVTATDQESDFILGPVEDVHSIHIDNKGRHCIVYGDKAISFYPLLTRAEAARLNAIQSSSRWIKENLICTSILAAWQAEEPGLNSKDRSLEKLQIHRDATSLAAINIQSSMELMESTKNGYLIGFDESERFLERVQIASPDVYKRAGRMKVLDTLPAAFNFSNPSREYPVSSKASDDGSLYLTLLAPNQSARLFDCESGKLLWNADNLGNDVSPVFVDDQAAVFRTDSSLQRFEWNSQHVRRFDVSSNITAACVSPDNRFIACLSAGTIYLIDTVTLEKVKHWSIPQQDAHTIEWGLGGDRLFVYSSKSICICDPTQAALILIFTVDGADGHNLTPQKDMAVFGGRMVSSRPFREHWKVWKETWGKEDIQQDNARSLNLVTELLSHELSLYDTWSEFKKDINEKIISSPGLTAIDRLSALTLLAAMSSFIDSRAENFTSELREEWIEQVIKSSKEELRLDETMEKVFRLVATVCFDCRTTLNSRAWKIVKSANREESEYKEGLLLAKEAAMRSRQHHVLNTLAIALYRNSEYSECLRILTEAEKGSGSGQDNPSHTLFEAMAKFRLGAIEAARSILSEFRSKSSDNLNEDEKLFLQEAIQLIGPDS